MNVSIIYESRFGNNSQIADRLIRTLEDRGHQTGRYLVSESEPDIMPSADLYVVGSPTQIGTLPLRIDRFLRNLELPAGSRFAVFTTGVGSASDTAEKISTILTDRGGVQISESLRLGVKDLRGPLEDDWETRLTDWCGTLLT